MADSSRSAPNKSQVLLMEMKPKCLPAHNNIIKDHIKHRKMKGKQKIYRFIKPKEHPNVLRSPRRESTTSLKHNPEHKPAPGRRGKVGKQLNKSREGSWCVNCLKYPSQRKR